MHQSIFNRYQTRLKTAGILAVALAIFASVLPQTALAQNSPVGIWELTMLKGRSGTAIVEFNSDFTLEGFEITSARQKKKSSSDERGRESRDGSSSDDGPSGTNTVTKSYGGAVVGGWWTYDQRGNIIGFYESISVFIGDENPTTNAVSFRGIVRPGQRINLMASTEEGRVVFRGVPSDPNDLSGDYILSIRSGGSETIEFVNLTPGILPNEFDVTGCGPGYFLVGTALITGRGSMSLQTISLDGEHFVAASGRYRSSRNRGVLRGTDIDNNFITIRITPNPNSGICGGLDL
jgi:hypothetical protein